MKIYQSPEDFPVYENVKMVASWHQQNVPEFSNRARLRLHWLAKKSV